jgi:hypothetical protein
LCDILKENIHSESEPLKESVIKYLFQLFILEKDERKIYSDAAVIAAVGAFPKGIHVPNYIVYLYFAIYVAISLYFRAFWMLFLFLLGNACGIGIYKLSKIENRSQFWRFIWILVILTCGIQYIDAYLSAKRDLKTVNFPVIVNVGLNDPLNTNLFSDDEKINTGFLLGFFKNKYFILSKDKSLGHKLYILESDQVSSIEVLYMRWLQSSINKSRNTLYEIAEDLSNLEEDGIDLIKEYRESRSDDPNIKKDINDIEENVERIREMKESIKKRIEEKKY